MCCIKKISLFYFAYLFSSSILFSQVIPGDINNDGNVDSLDIDRGVQIALDQPPPSSASELEAGDMNRDNRITVEDIVLISVTIAGNNRPPVADARASADSGLVGTDIQLDASLSSDLDGDVLTFSWTQLHMCRYSTEYISENTVIISDSTNATPTFNPIWPGNYRFLLSVTDTSGLVSIDTTDVHVGNDSLRKLDFKGVHTPDLFGDFGGPEYNLTPDDPDSQAVMLSRAMDGAIRTGAEWVDLVPMAIYTRINPLPEIRMVERDIFLTKKSDYAALVSAAKAKGLKVVHEQGLDLGPELRPGEIDSVEFLMNSSSEWWDKWYSEYENLMDSMTQWAQEYDVEMINLFSYAEDTFKPDVFPNYEDHWRQIITAMRQDYDGEICVNMIGISGLNFADALDALRITVFGGLYVENLADYKNPTIDEIKSWVEFTFEMHESDLSSQLPVYIDFSATSSDGQASNAPIQLPPSERDFREQVIYYEGFFQALEDEDWITGVNVPMWNWFDELDLPGFYFDEFTGFSTRNKPVEKFIKLWFDIY